MANQGLGKMHLDLYTSNSALTHKAKFWCNYVGALKGKKLYTTTWVEIIFKGAFFIQQPLQKVLMTVQGYRNRYNLLYKPGALYGVRP